MLEDAKKHFLGVCDLMTSDFVQQPVSGLKLKDWIEVYTIRKKYDATYIEKYVSSHGYRRNVIWWKVLQNKGYKYYGHPYSITDRTHLPILCRYIE